MVPCVWMKYPFNKVLVTQGGGQETREEEKKNKITCRHCIAPKWQCSSVKYEGVIVCEHVILLFRSSGFTNLAPLPPTEGLWECEKTIRGRRRRADRRTCFMCRKRREAEREPPRPSPHVNPPHKFSLVAVLYNTWLPNVAIRELSHGHYFEYIIILAALSHPAHHHFSLFSLFWIDKSFMRREHQVTWSAADASLARFIVSWGFAYVVECWSTSYPVLNGRSLPSLCCHFT